MRNDCELLNSDLEIGEYLKIKEKVANSKKEIKNSKFSKFNFQVKENEIFFEDEKIEKVFTKKNFLGKVH